MVYCDAYYEGNNLVLMHLTLMIKSNANDNHRGKQSISVFSNRCGNIMEIKELILRFFISTKDCTNAASFTFHVLCR